MFSQDVDFEHGLQAKTMRGPSFRKHLQFCLHINIPLPSPRHRPRFIHSFAVVVKCFSIYLMNFLLQCSKSLEQESNPSMRAKNSVGVILQEPSIHHSPTTSLHSHAAVLGCSSLAQFFITFKKPAFQKEDGEEKKFQGMATLYRSDMLI